MILQYNIPLNDCGRIEGGGTGSTYLPGCFIDSGSF